MYIYLYQWLCLPKVEDDLGPGKDPDDGDEV
jgi:hypothetical protein